MLPTAALVATLFAHARSPLTQATSATCPSIPGVVYRTSARLCPALDISGRADGMPLLEPVFDIDAPPESLTRIGVGSALLVGSAGDGRLLFAVALDVSGAFHVDLPLSPEAEIALVRLRLITSAGTVERTATAHGAPKAEAIATNDTSGVLAWNARAFPAVRVSVARGPVVAYGTGTSTYEQIDVPTDVRRIVVEFSDGLHSTTRTLQIFGR